MLGYLQLSFSSPLDNQIVFLVSNLGRWLEKLMIGNHLALLEDSRANLDHQLGLKIREVFLDKKKREGIKEEKK